MYCPLFVGNGKTLPNTEIELRVRQSAEKEFVRKLREAVRTELSTDAAEKGAPKSLEQIESGIQSTILQQFEAHLLLLEELRSLLRSKDTAVAKYKADLERKYPILSLISNWISEKLEIFELQFMREHHQELYENGLKKLTDQNFLQEAYFLEREQKYVNERELQVVNEIRRTERKPLRKFAFERLLWRPRNYRVFKNFYNRGKLVSERVEPNIFSSTAEKYSGTHLYCDRTFDPDYDLTVTLFS